MKPQAMPTTAALIRKARKAKGLSQGALAHQLGYLSSQNISGWECGDSGIPMTAYNAICTKLAIGKREFQVAVLRDYEIKLKKIMN